MGQGRASLLDRVYDLLAQRGARCVVTTTLGLYVEDPAVAQPVVADEVVGLEVLGWGWG